MRTRHAVHAAVIVAAMAMPMAAWAAPQQSPVHNMAGMGQPSSQAAVAACAQAQLQALQTLEAANQRLEAVRQGNSPAAMRATVDDLQGALRQLRALLGACAGLQAASAADMPVGHVMPGGQPMPNTAQAPPGAANPQAGHIMPAAPQTPAAAPRGAPAQQSAAAAPPSSGQATPAPGADPHAGHMMPGTPSRRTPSPAASADPHMGHMMPAAPQAPADTTPVVHALTTVESPAARLADLSCQPQVDPDTAPRATYLGKAYYFCTAADRDLFLKTPAKYLRR